LAALVVAVVGMVIRRRAAPGSPGGMAYQRAGGASLQSGNSQFDPATPRSYSPQNVGNDASARPWERSGSATLDTAQASGGSMIGSALMGRQTWGIPADFDADGFLQASKANFVSLQDAWDRADIPSLRAMMTDGMLEQIRSQLAERETAGPGGVNKTEVVMLDAQLLGIEELDDGYMASVEFAGMIREEANAGPNPFREVWNITRPKTGSGGWLVAGVQALQ
jgi:predicted lipid-binding transport protein (Tim44 family)